MPDKKPPYGEKRRFPRVAVDFDVVYRPIESTNGEKIPKSKKNEVLTDRLITLGEGGCFIQTKKTYPKGTRISVNFVLDGHAINAIAKVRYEIPYNSKSSSVQFPGIGMEFEEIDDGQVKQIKKYVAKEQLKQGLGLNSDSKL